MTHHTETLNGAEDNVYSSRAASQTVSMSSQFGENPIKRNTSEDNIRNSVESLRDGPPSILRQRQIEAFRDGGGGLPAEKGFPIQIGSELFRLSGASIMSDGLRIAIHTSGSNGSDCFRAPSYFSKFFEDQLRNNNNGDGGVKTLYIDRDPATFQDIACHLQGTSAGSQVSLCIFTLGRLPCTNPQWAALREAFCGCPVL